MFVLLRCLYAFFFGINNYWEGFKVSFAVSLVEWCIQSLEKLVFFFFCIQIPSCLNKVFLHAFLQINQYLSLYARSGILPSELLQGKAAEVCHPCKCLVFYLFFNIYHHRVRILFFDLVFLILKNWCLWSNLSNWVKSAWSVFFFF